MSTADDLAMQNEAREAIDLLDNDLDAIEAGLNGNVTASGAAVAIAQVVIAAARLGSRIFRSINDHSL